MSYVVLARRYRPQAFSDLVGQGHVTVTLKNAIRLKRTAHAYLFTGPRGVGKTSAARILAKALRCLNPKEDGEPCNECAACEGVNNGSSLDVIEIDAASNTGVDNIRDLRENVEYMATVGRYRVYIIDEVHMLSTAAFNALLKTLEEPPPHVVFIFATTELHKVLPTIQSRCQRFDFKRISPEVMSANLQEICSRENVQIDDAALRTLVVESEGCLRDAQSLLDQAIALCGENIEMGKLERALGLLDRSSFLTLIENIADHNPGAALKLCAQMLVKGVDAKVLLNRLVDFFSDLHYRAFTGESRMPDPDLDRVMSACVSKLSPDEIIRALDLGLRTQTLLGQSSHTSLTVESFVVKLCLQRPVAPALGSSVEEVSARPVATPSRASSSAAPAPAAAPRATEARASEPRPAPAAPQQTLTKPHLPPVAGGTGLGPLETFIRNQKPAWTPVLQSILQVDVEEGQVRVRAKSDFAGKRLASNDGIEVLKTAYGLPRAVVQLESPANGLSGGAPSTSPQEKFIQKHHLAKEHDAVKAAIRVFDAVITETKVLDDPSGGGLRDQSKER